MKTHTPGPWKIEMRTRSGEFVRTTHITGTDGSHLANVGPCSIDANARLIAAAPDLLAALEDIVYLADTSDFYLPRNWLADARAAIAKAEGNA